MTTLKRSLAIPLLFFATVGAARDYHFDGSMPREVLESYLSRAITVADLLTGRGDLQDNIRMLKNIGAKFAGRSVYVWGHESRLPQTLELAKKNAAIVHQADPELILQACVFEAVSHEVEQLAVPAWAFEALDRPIEHRNFRYADMIYASGLSVDRWGHGASVPDISRPETQLWFFYAAASYIDAGAEAIHFGQVQLMNGNDPHGEHWWHVLSLVRQYAARHARRHFLLCDGHVPGGGLLYKGHLLLDFHSFPLRVAEVRERPQEGELRVGYVDGIYGRSRGGLTSSGWRCEHLPYLVELDNYGASHQPGHPGLGHYWVWGYDEICWFAQQSSDYRNAWLRYAWKWVREHDDAGYLEMPGSRKLDAPAGDKHWYFANMPSKATPDGFGQEETIRQIWTGDGR